MKLKKNSLNKIIILLIIISTINNYNLKCSANSNNNDINWTMFQYDTFHSGYQTFKGSGNISNYGILWRKQFDMVTIYGEPAVADIDLSGDKEIIIGNDNGYLYCLDINGKIIWQYITKADSSLIFGGRISSTAALVDIIGDESLEIIFNSGKMVYCLSAQGELIWNYETGDMIDSSVVVGDITGNGDLDIALTSYDGYLYTLTNDGKLIWKYLVDEEGGGTISTPVIVDLNSDGINDIITGGAENGIIYAITTEKRIVNSNLISNYKPKELWTFETQLVDNLGILGSPVVIDINRDGRYETIIGASDSGIYCLDNEGKRLWVTYLNGPIYNTPAIADINDDGNYEIIIGTSGEQLYALDSKGNILWSIKYQDKIVPNPVIFDVDGDNLLEITSIDESRQPNRPGSTPVIKSINILNFKGEVIHKLEYAFKTYGDFIGVSIVDLNSDGILEILTGTNDGYLYCYGELENNSNNNNGNDSNNINNINGSSVDMKNFTEIFLQILGIIVLIIIIAAIILKLKNRNRIKS